MKGFTSIDPKAMQENAIDLLANKWMLVTSGALSDTNKTWNTMTASWGGLGYLWNKPVAFVFVRPERFTYEFTENNDTMTLSFFPEEYKKTLAFCGAKSGRDCDKAKETGLAPIKTDNNSVSFEQATLVLECKKLYIDMLNDESFLDTESKEKWYSKEGLHRVYICEITKAWKK